MSQMRVTQHVRAPRSEVYRALLDPVAVATWKVPYGMTCRVHAFDAREGGKFRISLTYENGSSRGKSAQYTDTYRGAFTKLVPNERVVEVDEFETNAAALRGQVTITTTLADRKGGTEVTMDYDGLPAGVSLTENEVGTKMALEKLAAFLEGPSALAEGLVLELGFPKFTPLITFRGGRTLTVEIIAGENEGFSDTVEYEVASVRRGLVVLSWRERIGSTIALVLDLLAREAYTVVTPAKGGFMRLKGPVEVKSSAR